MARASSSEKEELKLTFDRVSVFVLLLVSFLYLVPSLVYPRIHFGQLGKQTFAAQMIESTAKGELTYGVFPTRHFVEVYHDGLVPWAEEVPLYSFLSAGLVRAFSISPIFAGKLLSFLSFLFILFGFARIAKILKFSPLAFVLTAGIYPVFRLYSVQVMPDLCMTAALVWMIAAILEEKVLIAALLLLIASLFKYYAVFTGFGVGLYFLYRRNAKGALYFSLAILPCIAYVLWFLELKIPNPIVDSRVADGHGHFSSLANVLSLANWSRVGLWWFVKNASLPGTGLAALGFWVMLKEKLSIRPFFACLCVGLLLFPFVFISSFYVHDYYGLQGSIGIALLACIGVDWLFSKNKAISSVCLIVFLGFSIMNDNFMLKKEPDFEVVEAAVESLNLPKNEFVLAVSGISKPVISYHLGQDAYIVGIDEWAHPNVQARIMDPRIKVAFIHGFKTYEDMLRPIEADLTRLGFKKIELDLTLTNTQFEVWKKN